MPRVTVGCTVTHMEYSLNIDNRTLREMAAMPWSQLGAVINGNIHAAALAHGDEMTIDEEAGMIFTLFMVLCSDLGYSHIPIGMLGDFFFTSDCSLNEFLSQFPENVA